ncbi:response regulator [Myxococcaceae bacterium JPH2]|nr:response regulator [Myxococcaceae bacterium JPH2]
MTTTRNATTAVPSKPPATRQRVLLVDDSRSIRTLLKLYLMERGFEFLEANSAEEALAVVRHEPLDLVITDFNMPGVNGASFVRLLRLSDNPRVRKMPVLMMTSDERPQHVQAEGVAAGVSAFLRKPAQCADLLATVARLLPSTPLRAS